MPPETSSQLKKSFLKYQHLFVLIAPLLFVVGVVTTAPTPTDAGLDYWLRYWWMFFFFLLGATTVNTVGISGSALFVPFLIFAFPVLANALAPNTLLKVPLEPSTLVKIGLISESFGLSSSAVAFVQYGLVDRRLAVTLVGGSVPFVIGGAVLSFFIPDPLFHAALGLALLAAAYLLYSADLDHESAESADDPVADETVADGDEAVPDGGEESGADGTGLPDDADKLGDAGVAVEGDDVTRVTRAGDTYSYTWSGYLERFANYSVGGLFQGLAGFGIGELGIISQLRTNVPVRVAIGTNHIVVALTAILASLVHVFGGGLVPGAHSLSLASTPWNIVVFTVPATVIGGQVAPYVSNTLDTDTLTLGVAGLFGVISVALFLMAVGVA
ncbi:MAG: TSUP family transporter [Halobaculum sp.]